VFPSLNLQEPATASSKPALRVFTPTRPGHSTNAAIDTFDSAAKVTAAKILLLITILYLSITKIIGYSFGTLNTEAKFIPSVIDIQDQAVS
jgi:hypothetical protein